MRTNRPRHYNTRFHDEFTPRQRAVLDLLARGYTNGQIAEELGISLDGAKYHVSEILQKLGVDSREEAAEYWREFNSPRARIGRAISLALLLGPMRAVLIAAAGVLALGAAVTFVVVGSRGSSPGGTSHAIESATTAVAPTEIATFEATPQPPPDGPVAFKTCEVNMEWKRPSLTEMRDVLTDKRFGDGKRPYLIDFALYLSPAYFIGEVHSVSVNKDTVAMSRANDAVGQPPASGTPFARLCGSDEFSQDKDFQSVWLVDHRAVSMRGVAGTLVVEVEPDPHTFQAVNFPDPALLRGQLGPRFVSLRVEDKHGRPLFSNSMVPRGGMVGYEDDGRLRFASLSGLGGDLAFELYTPQEVEIIGQSIAPLDGRLSITDGSGSVIREINGILGPANEWITLTTASLPAGRYTVRFASQNSQFGGLLVLPAGTPWP
jgi:DNA-binding CsgD family transcriptional regulator